MAAPPSQRPVIEEEEEYESDEYEVEDDGDADFQGEEGEEDDDDVEGDEEESGENLTALLVPDADPAALFDDEDDGGYAPPGETDPADEPIDGNARALTPEQLPEIEDSLTAKGVTPLAPPTAAAAAAGMKRKTSSDEEEEDDDEEEEESDAKKLKS